MTTRIRTRLLLLLGTLLLLTACASQIPPDDAGADSATESLPPSPTAPFPTLKPTATIISAVPQETAEIETNPDYDPGLAPRHLARVAANWKTDWGMHTVNYSEIISGGVLRDQIRSIDEPEHTSFSEADQWLADTEPVIALEINSEARAYPLSILTRHEISNDTLGGVPVVVTFCPLCNSALVFDRRVNGEVYEFGVSGLLRNSDLIMYDRTTESLWQQFTGEGIVGSHAGDSLEFIPSSTISYGDFKEAYSDGSVLSNHGRVYGVNPYYNYDQTTGRPFLFTGRMDSRLPPMMRVVGILDGTEAIAYPYSTLLELNVVNDRINEQDIVIFYKLGTNSALGASVIAEAEDVGAAAVYDALVNGEVLTFRFEDGQFVDNETNSTWNILGQAVAGALEGTVLMPLVHSDHFWFSWAAFYPETKIYTTNAE